MDGEIEKFRNAVEKTVNDLQRLKDKMIANGEGESASVDILEAHQLIVQDRVLHHDVISRIQKEKISAIYALNLTIQHYMTVFSSMNDPYLKERAEDVKDVGKRLLDHLQGVEHPDFDSWNEPVLLVAKDLTPSDAAMMDRKKVLGFSVENGSKTCHSAILARSMKIPAVVGMQRLYNSLHDGDRMIIDGFQGIVVLHPEEETLEFYRRKMRENEDIYRMWMKESHLAAETLDGSRIKIVANMEGVFDHNELFESGAEGIGLYRTEYLFLNSSMMPSEESQYHVYRKLVKNMNGKPVTIRTQDIGGDKNALFADNHEENPFLGMRAIRLCKDFPDIMKTQLRAILRASAHGNVKIMFPMVSSIEELDYLLDVLAQSKEELRQEQEKFDESVKVGIMVEIPSAALIAEDFAKKIDFFSIGTNDLVQYTLAVDRTNEHVAHLYRPSHPAVMRLINMVIRAGEKQGIPVCICGEMASDPMYIPVFVGMGATELSMNQASIVAARKIIRRIRKSEVEKIADDITQPQKNAEAIRSIREMLVKTVPDIMSIIQPQFNV